MFVLLFSLLEPIPNHIEPVMNPVKKLNVYQKAFRLSIFVYKITKFFPKEELFGLTSQMRRCAVSVPSNIAEGKGRYSDKEYVRFLAIARGSLFELQTQLDIAKEIGYIIDIDDEDLKIVNELIIEIGKMLTSMINKLS